MSKVDPNQNNSTPECCLHNLFHFTVKSEDSTIKKILTILGYTLFHITTLGIPLLVHHLWAHNCCRGGDGLNTLSNIQTPRQKTIDDSISGVQSVQEIGAQSGVPSIESSDSDGDSPLEHVLPKQDSPPPSRKPTPDRKSPTEPAKPQITEPIAPEITEAITHPIPETIPPEVPVTTIDPNSLEGMRLAYFLKKAPQCCYPLCLDLPIMNPNFTVSYPMSVLEYFDKDGSLEKSQESPSDSADQKKIKQLRRQQITNLNDDYLLLEVKGDGKCFYRAYATSWLMHLTRSFSLNTNSFKEAAEQILRLREFGASSTLNRTLMKEAAHILLRAQHLIPVSPKTVMDRIILEPRSMDGVFIPLLQALASFESQQHILRMAGDEGGENAKAVILTHLLEDPVNMINCIKVLAQNESLRSQFSSSFIKPCPGESNQTSSIIRQAVSLGFTNPLLTARNPALQQLLTCYLPKEFLIIDAQSITYPSILSMVCDTRPIFKRAWEELDTQTKSAIPESCLRVYGFLKTYEKSLKEILPEHILTQVNAFTDNMRATINEVLNITSEDTLRHNPELIQSVVRTCQNFTLSCTFMNSFFARPEIFDATTPGTSTIRKFCRVLEENPPLSHRFIPLYREAYNSLAPQAQLHFNQFLMTPPLNEIQKKKILSEANIFFLFLLLQESKVRALDRTSPLRIFLNLAEFEVTRCLNITPTEQESRSTAAVATISLLSSQMPSPLSLFSSKPSISDEEQTHGFVRGLIRTIEQKPQLMIAHRLFLRWASELGTTPAFSPEEAEEKIQRALQKLEALYPKVFGKFVEEFEQILPQKVSIGIDYKIYLFLLGSTERKQKAVTVEELIPFTTPFEKALEATFLTKIAPTISTDTVQQLVAYLDGFSEKARLFCLQFIREPYCLNLIFDFLKGISLVDLHRIYSSAVTQAEGDHVEAVSHALILPAICENLSSTNQMLDLHSAEQLAQTRGFLKNFSPEMTAAIHILRMTNHYCCLIPKRDN